MYPAEEYLYWTDTWLDKIEIIDLNNHTFRYIPLQLPPLYYLFGIAVYFEDIYFSEFNSDYVYAIDYPAGTVRTLQSSLGTPTELHVYAGNAPTSHQNGMHIFCRNIHLCLCVYECNYACTHSHWQTHTHTHTHTHTQLKVALEVIKWTAK